MIPSFITTLIYVEKLTISMPTLIPLIQTQLIMTREELI
nr:MAG TPA: hypothetical protein [Crassvirales sp.]